MKTVDDILREMREFADTDSQTIGRDVLRREIHHFADRIKVAVVENATTTPTSKESLEVGDMAAMLNALKKINSLCGIGVVDVSSFEIGSICDSAIAKPPRNCDVGTAEEQIKRWQKFCETQTCCEKCPYYKCGDMCFARWAQMPKEEVK